MTDEELVKLLAATNEQLQQALKEQSSVSDRLVEANEKMKEKFLVVMAERDEAWRRAGHAEEQWGRCEIKLATCEKYRDAYAACDRIGTQAVRDLEAKLAECLERNALLEARLGKAVEALRKIADAFGCECGDAARATLAEIEGEKT
jgi:DNA repair exonuclease SbcCD ATPase subunit